MSGAVQQVIVHGGGIAAPMAALAIARAYTRLGVEVTWADTGEAPAPHSALVAPPDLATFHRLLGIDDKTLTTHAAATLNMGQQFAGWSGGDSAFIHAYGDAGSAYADLPFVQHWSRARAAGLRVALEDFSLAAAAAKEGRTGAPDNPATRQAVKAGWHLDAAGYAALLRTGCEGAGVRIVAAANAAPRIENGRIGALDLGGETLEADLYIDTDGKLVDALDSAAADPDPGRPWCDLLLRASAPPFGPLPLYSRVAAHAAGWLTLIPLADRTALEFHYDSRYLADADAPAMLAALTGLKLDAVLEPVAATARAHLWTGNAVALGRAAGSAPPLDGAELLLLQLSIAQLVLLWPLDAADMPEADIYNEEIGGTWSRVRDFTAQHFRLNARSEPYWTDARAAPISPELAAKIDLFAARGMFAHFNHEAHVEDGWALVMAGHGIVPRGFDPQALRVEDQALMAEFQRQLRAVATDVRAMESHADALGRLRA